MISENIFSAIPNLQFTKLMLSARKKNLCTNRKKRKEKFINYFLNIINQIIIQKTRKKLSICKLIEFLFRNRPIEAE